MTKNRRNGQGKSNGTLRAKGLLKRLDLGLIADRLKGDVKNPVTIPVPQGLRKFSQKGAR